MEKMKYIPFDLVKVKHKAFSELEGCVFVVEVADPTNKITLESGEVLNGRYIVRKKDSRFSIVMNNKYLVPIELTIDILTKNGWKQTRHVVDHHGYEYYLYENGNEILPEIQYYPKGDWHDEDRFSAFWGGAEIRPDIHYLHELQHLLFGLNLPSDLKI